jgi:hypothetical protein
MTTTAAGHAERVAATPMVEEAFRSLAAELGYRPLPDRGTLVLASVAPAHAGRFRAPNTRLREYGPEPITNPRRRRWEATWNPPRG